MVIVCQAQQSSILCTLLRYTHVFSWNQNKNNMKSKFIKRIRFHISNGSTIICYQFTCNQNQLISASLAIQTFAIKHINSVAITFICYPALTAIDTFAIKLHLLSGQFAINPHVVINNFAINHHLLSNFRLPLNPYFYHFFSLLKICKFLNIWKSSFAGNDKVSTLAF